MIEQDACGDHHCQGKEKPRSVELPQAGILQLINPRNILPAGILEDRQGLEYAQEYARTDEIPGAEHAIIQLPGLMDKFQAAAKEHETANIPDGTRQDEKSLFSRFHKFAIGKSLYQ